VPLPRGEPGVSPAPRWASRTAAFSPMRRLCRPRAPSLPHLVRSTSLAEVVDDYCFDSLRRLLVAASSRVEQADGGLGHDCPIPPIAEARTQRIPLRDASPFS
jgi:hypothetical protein